MHVRIASFSFTRLTDPRRHVDYNIWHQLQHRPENLALPGIVYGERWVNSPACAAASQRLDAALEVFHYLNIYWFREPAAESIAEWQELAQRQFQLGQRLDAHHAERPFFGMFSIVKTYVNPSLPFGPDALTFRPTRGIHVRFTEIAESHAAETELMYARHDRLLTRLVATPGIAGATLFMSDNRLLPTAAASGSELGKMRISLSFLDRNPIELAPVINSAWAEIAEPASQTKIERVLFSGVLETITPWEWGWFDPIREGTPESRAAR
jgi:hypothetical protein